jgi:hypothetical protein
MVPEVGVELAHIRTCEGSTFSPAVLRKCGHLAPRPWRHLSTSMLTIRSRPRRTRSEVFPGQGLAVQVSVEAPEALEPAQAEPESPQIRDEDVLVVSHDDRNHLAFSAHQKRNLSLNLERNGTKLAGQFMSDDFVTGYTATVKVLEKLHLVGFQSACFAINPIDISNLIKERGTLHGSGYKEYLGTTSPLCRCFYA